MARAGVEHVLVLSDDIDATRDFYVEVLGLREGKRPPLEFPGYWLYAGDSPCVHVAARGPYAAHARTLGLEAGGGRGGGAIDHLAFSAGDFEEVLARLRTAGLRPVENVVPGVMRQLFVEDPNGVRIEINVND